MPRCPQYYGPESGLLKRDVSPLMAMFRRSFDCHIAAAGRTHVVRRPRPILGASIDRLCRRRCISADRVDGGCEKHSARRPEFRGGSRCRLPARLPHRHDALVARILDAAYRMPGGMVILPMTDDLQVNSKGMDLDARFFIALRGSDECHFVERRTNHHAMIIFSPGMSDRGWFDQADDLRAYVANRPALLHIRQLLLDILRTASVQPALFETTEVAAHLQEGLLLALDDLFRIDSLSDRSASVQGERSIKLVQRIDDYVAAHPTAPIYTADLAGEFGVSIRTLGGAVSKVRGMSLHQYIRLKKLWATRSRLLKGS